MHRASRHLTGDNGGAGPAERLVYSLSRRGIVLDRAPHAFHRLLGAVTVATVFTRIDRPQRGLLAVASPRSLAPRCIPAGLVLPMVMAAAQRKPILGPD